MRSKILSALVAAASLAPLAAFAAPATTLYGGGATFPASAYHGNEFIKGPVGGTPPAVSPRLTSAGAAGSYFGAYTASTLTTPFPFPTGATSRPAVSYCQTGSGTGKNVITGASSRVVTGTCPDFASSPTGFGAPSGTVDADFAGTDSPLSASDWSAYQTNKSATRVQPVQIPVVAGAIGIVYNNPQTGASIGVAPPVITLSKVCQIFSGQITNWNQISAAFPSKAIKVIYRSDGSGTSFGFSNHLSYVCPTATPNAVTGFSTQQTFSAAFPGGVAPAGALGASGNNGVLTTVAANDGAIGYADVSDAIDRASINPALKEVQYFTLAAGEGINGLTGKKYKAKSPAKISAKFKVATGGVVFDKILGANDANGRPTIVSLSPVPPKSSCIMLANPDSYATSALDANGDFKSYPIMAVSYLVFHSAGNGENTQNLRQLASGFFGAAVKPNLTATPPVLGNIAGNTTTIAPSRGFSYLAGFANPTSTTITNCIVP